MLLLTTLAGLSTGIGGAIAFFAQRTNRGLLAGALGFSAGVMIYVSFVELFFSGRTLLAETLGPTSAEIVTVACFFGGMILTAVIDFLVPNVENPHESVLVEEMATVPDDASLHRLGMFAAFAIALHNFPEGFATMITAQADPALGVSVAVAVALHNIPEGIAIAVPIFYATGSKWKAFSFSFLSGLAEPVGAILGYLLLRPFLSESLVGATLAFVAGIMVFISLDQLIPNAKKFGKGHQAVYGLIGGMAVMAMSLLVL